MTDKQEVIINNINLDDVKKLLYTGQRTAITTATFEKIIELLEEKTAECEELKAKLKEKDSELSKKCFELLEKKARIAQLIDENATKEVIYKINGKCAKTTANRVKEITAIVNNKAIIYEQQDQYKQALDEIEEYTKTTLRMPLERRVILDIISKAKGEGNNEG